MICKPVVASITIIALLLLLGPVTYGMKVQEDLKHFQENKQTHPHDSLINKLVNDGFNRTDLITIFNDPRVGFLETVLTINLINKYVKADYSRFLHKQSVTHAKKFLQSESAFLTQVEARYQVEKEVIVSILLIESSFGANTGNNTVFNVFFTLAQATDPEILQTTYQRLKEQYPQLSREEIELRAEKKSQWAYQELKNLLTIARRENLDVLNIKGSWAGAFGIAQFLPSSYLQYGVDGNKDRKVRLYNRYDSIESVANYLKEKGWKEGLTEKKKRTIIRQYNNSTPYIDTVLKLSQKISG
jgi:membrane-bound lytic murein transglycosylase B